MVTVVIPLDGSELSERALGLGTALATAIDGSIDLVYVVEEPFLAELAPGRMDADRDSAQEYLDGVARRLDDRVSVSTRVLYGRAADELLTLAEDEPRAVLVMSSHGRGGIGRIMFGSVTDKVLRGAAVPVAIVRNEGLAPDARLSNLIVPLDGSDLAEAALAEAVEFTLAFNATIHLVRVIEPFWRSSYMAFVPEIAYPSSEYVAEVEQQLETEARVYLDNIAQRLRTQGLSVTWEVRSGRPVDEIVRTAETIGADLIVMSTHGRGGVRRWAFGSVTNEVLHRAETPVLAIPPGRIAAQESDRARLVSSA
jgi:nucleotide-binding universal stress UspA family protein